MHWLEMGRRDAKQRRGDGDREKPETAKRGKKRKRMKKKKVVRDRKCTMDKRKEGKYKKEKHL